MVKPSKCKGCVFERTWYGFFPRIEGRGNLGIELVVESVEQGDGNRGKVVTEYGMQGSVWNRIVGKLGYRFEEFGYDSLVRCVPKWKGGLGEAGKSCQSRYGGFEKAEAKLYVVSGKAASEEALGMSLNGKFDLGYVHGFVFERPWGYVMPIADLRMVRQGQFVYHWQVERDVEKAIEFVKGLWKPFEDRDKKRFVVNAGGGELEYVSRVLRDNPKAWLAYDLEGEDIGKDEDEKELGDYNVYSVQFSVKRHEAFEFKVGVDPGLWDGVREILRGRNVKVAHNVWLFDNPILRAKGIEVNGLVVDSMWAFKHYYAAGGVDKKEGEDKVKTGVRKHLQTVASMAKYPFPWKHLRGESESVYGCCDVDALRYIYPWIRKGLQELKGQGWDCWRGFVEHGIRLEEIQRGASERGISVNAKKLDELRLRVEGEIAAAQAEIEKGVPDEIKARKAYKRVPPDVRKWVKHAKSKGVDEPRLSRIVEAKAAQEGYRVAEGTWSKVMPFKLSNQGLKRYVEWMRKTQPTKARRDAWTLPKDCKTGNETTGKDALERLAKRTGDALLLSVLQSRSKGSLVNNLVKNWKPGEDGKVHTQFRYDAPTGQLSSKKPNVQNVTKHNANGQELRKVIKAERDKVWIEFDCKSFHVGVLGFLAGDERYYALSQADMHSVVYSHILGRNPIRLDLEIGEIKKLCKVLRRDMEFERGRTKQAKPTVLGNQLGLGPTRLWLSNAPDIKSREHAMELQGMLAKMFPKVEEYKRRIRSVAHREEVLVNWYGRLQRFYQVFTTEWDERNRPYLKWGQEHDKVMAFAVQSNAFGYVFEKLRIMEREGMLEGFGYVDTIHDSVLFECEERLAERCIVEVKEVMERPSDVMKGGFMPEGFWVGCEVSMGKNWGTWKQGVNEEGMKEVEV